MAATFCIALFLALAVGSYSQNVTEPMTTTSSLPVEPVLPLEPVRPTTRKCKCRLRAANAKTDWTFMNKYLTKVLEEDVEDNIQMTFKSEPKDCLNDVSRKCATHCKSLGFQLEQQLAVKNMTSIGDLVCSHVQWRNSRYRFLKVEVTSLAECRGAPRSERRMTAYPLIDDLCCQRSDEQWTGYQCKRNAVVG